MLFFCNLVPINLLSFGHPSPLPPSSKDFLKEFCFILLCPLTCSCCLCVEYEVLYLPSCFTLFFRLIRLSFKTQLTWDFPVSQGRQQLPFPLLLTYSPDENTCLGVLWGFLKLLSPPPQHCKFPEHSAWSCRFIPLFLWTYHNIWLIVCLL